MRILHMHSATDPLTLAVACEIRYRNSQSDCGFGGWYTWSFTYSRKWKSYAIMSGGLRRRELCSHLPITNIILLFALETPFSFNSDWSATRN
jgi:hypothetical protein